MALPVLNFSLSSRESNFLEGAYKNMPQNEVNPPVPTWNPENVFQGTAWYYARYRPGYPDEVINLLRDKFHLGANSRILDLGCGTGQAALKLAPHVSRVVAIDPQDEMLGEGKMAAASQGISNIAWLKGESGKLPEMTPQIGEVSLTVIARAFHWMDRDQTLADLFKITHPGGGVAIVADSGLFEVSDIAWKQVIVQTVQKWLGAERKAGTEGTFKHPAKTFETSFSESQFGNFTSAVINTERQWTVDEIIGYMYSTSLASPPVLGDKKELFEADLRERLREIEPSGQFTEPVTVKVMMVWKNGR
jgi:ubiquinone/menaquinone biosynthesis C-methylase UbiE